MNTFKKVILAAILASASVVNAAKREVLIENYNDSGISYLVDITTLGNKVSPKTIHALIDAFINHPDRNGGKLVSIFTENSDDKKVLEVSVPAEILTKENANKEFDVAENVEIALAQADEELNRQHQSSALILRHNPPQKPDYKTIRFVFALRQAAIAQANLERQACLNAQRVQEQELKEAAAKKEAMNVEAADVVVELKTQAPIANKRKRENSVDGGKKAIRTEESFYAYSNQALKEMNVETVENVNKEESKAAEVKQPEAQAQGCGQRAKRVFVKVKRKLAHDLTSLANMFE